ncbi:MAG: efflux RND transporter periplasmic adaptor subunit, partial [Chthonomonas sp.]|nr:efflux RND transporter periplasmic adaptor subunit [Chthonomonas sp.]
MKVLRIGFFAFSVASLMLVGCRQSTSEIEYKYAKISKGELIRSMTANGTLVAMTSVDVKSKAGGKVIKLAVDEGQIVKKGDLIALIDPSDTQATFDQASADLQSTQSRVQQSMANLDVQRSNARSAVRDAEIAVKSAQIRYDRALLQESTQPELTKNDVASAAANLQSQRQALRELETATLPQARRDAQVALDRTKAEFDAAKANERRQRDLLAKGYVSVATVEAATSAMESARAAYESSKIRMENLDAQQEAQRASQLARVSDADAAYRKALANQSQIKITKQNADESAQAVAQAKSDLDKARANLASIRASEADLASARASIVRNRVAVKNAKVQLDSTTVVAPRDGVVTQKYLEEGTIIPPGTSTFSQGTSLVQLSDVSRIFVDCLVDEADISQVEVGQKVRILLQAFPHRPLKGEVSRVSPAALTANNITTVKVRVEVRPAKGVEMMPGMTATCEFITFEKSDVLVLPSQALNRKDGETTVKIKDAKGTPKVVKVKVGETGNDGVELLEGLKAGDEVVVAEIDLDKMRALQKKMEEAQQGGGLAGGRPAGMGGGSGGRSGGGGGS